MRFGTDGVRGVANTELTAAFALSLGRAAARVLRPSIAVVGGDTRLSTPMLEAAVTAGLAAEGVDVHRLGVLPTPAIAHFAAELGAMGVVVSASHNPYHHNGIKLFAPGGTKLSDDVEERIEAELDALGDPAGEPGRVLDDEEGPRRERVLAGYATHVAAAIDGRSLGGVRVVVDTANGAASPIAAAVLEHAGADVVVINADPDGRNINDRCGATDPSTLARAVVEHGAQAGLALDGDADRLIAADELGHVVDGDRVIAICARDLDARGALRDHAVVVTVMTNLGFRIAMREAGIDVIETQVGDRYVLEALHRGGYSLGGEQSGHVIFPELATTGDGLLTGVVLLDVMRRSRRPLSDLASSSMTVLPQVLVNVAVDGAASGVAERMHAEIAAATALLGETGRVLVRPSGTEPLVRVMVEAPTPELAQQVADDLAGAVVAHAMG
ncbi:MAG TPA: phosphoglucosamine mutase [Ilumatobacteraceae bacterium]